MSEERAGNGAGVVTKLSQRSVADTVLRLKEPKLAGIDPLTDVLVRG